MRGGFSHHSSARGVLLQLRRAWLSAAEAPEEAPEEAKARGPPAELGLRERLSALLTSIFVVQDTDFVRADVQEPPSARANESRPVFEWGGSDGDEALRLPRGVAAAERLAVGRDSSVPTPPPPLRDDQIRDAKKEPVAVAAVLVIIVFQLVGSLIGLTREVLPMEYQGAAVMEEAVDVRSSDSR